MVWGLREITEPVNCALDVSSRQERECVARINRESSILRFHPLPLASRVVPNLKRRNRLTEEESKAAEVFREVSLRQSQPWVCWTYRYVRKTSSSVSYFLLH